MFFKIIPFLNYFNDNPEFIDGSYEISIARVPYENDADRDVVKNKIEAANIKEECLSYFPALANCMGKRGGNLSGGQRQMLSFAMLLSQQTQCWLLDEPTAGLSPDAVKEATAFLIKMKQLFKLNILIVVMVSEFMFQIKSFKI